jgi:hypothetical protein
MMSIHLTRLLQHFGSFFANYLPNIDLSPKGLFGSIAKQGCLLGHGSGHQFWSPDD